MSESISVLVSEHATVSSAAGNSSGRIYWVGGSKGGVGKSMMTLATVDHLLERGDNVLLVECDTSNPDVWKAYKEEVETELIDLDEADGWIHLVNTCDNRRDSVVVINTAARNNLAVKQYGSTLDSSLEELGSKLVALWVIDAVPKAAVHVVRNGYFGEERQFELYNGSKIREEVESRGGKSITLPDLADRVADDIYVRRISLKVAARELPIGKPRGAGEVARERAQGPCRSLVVSVEDTFAKVLGRHASDEERQRLYRLRDALGLRDNDAFWSIVMAREYYDSFFRQYPALLAEHTERCIKDARAAFAEAAAREAAHAQRTLSEKVAETSVAIARRLAERPVGIHRVTMLLAAVVAFGALCVSAGYSLAAPVKPFWVAKGETITPLQKAAAVMLAAPAGWMVFALLVPAAVYGARVGWVTASESVERRDKMVGWGIVVACIFASTACAVMLAKLI